MLYFSPFSYANELKLDSTLFPETIFNEHYSQLKHIVKRRQKNLSNSKILDRTRYQVGNLVLAVNHPVKNAETKGQSQELAMTVRGIYYIKSIHPAHLRLIGLFTGEERNLPKEFCVKISLDNLSTLQAQLQSLQLQKVSSSLFRANKFLPPDQAKTWSFLLDKNSHTEKDESCDLSELENFDLDRSETSPEIAVTVQDGVQISGPLPDMRISPLSQTGQTAHGVSQLEESDPQVRQKKILRYGRAYFSLLTQPLPRSILKPSSLLQTVPPVPSNSETGVKPPGHQFPGHGVNKVKKSVEWANTLTIRFTQGEDIRDFDQILLNHTESSCILPPTSYLMLCSLGVDTSHKELIYKSTWSSPNLSNDILQFI